MKIKIESVKNTPLFAGIEESALSSLLQCLAATAKTYKKGETVFWQGEPVQAVGIICYGNIQVTKEDFMGNRTILASFKEGELFGEAFACAMITHIPVHIISATDSEILFIDYKKIITTCPSSCVFHKLLIENMLKTLAAKNVLLNQKIDILSKRSTREKLIVYLSDCAQKAGSKSFTIPYDRQELADFLCVERSAMSAELSKMQTEGLLLTNRSHFEVLALAGTD